MLTLDSITNLRENNRFEAKEAFGGLPKSIWETYSAFANTDGGVIVLGAKELGDHSLKVMGLPDANRLAQLFWDGANNPSCVSRNILVNADVEVIKLEEKDIVAIHVPRASSVDKPIYLKDNPFRHTYRRNGEGDYRCTEDEVRAMIRDGGDKRPGKEILVDFDLSALCEETITAYRNTLATARPRHPWNSLSAEELLVRLEAVRRSREDGELHPTAAGLLMFGEAHHIVNRFPDFFLDYREASEKTKWDTRFTSDDGDWSGNVFDFWRRASVKLTEILPRPYTTRSLYRVEDTPMHEALREALANTLIHADYDGSVGCVVVRYDERATFTNPGVPLVSVSEATAGGLSLTRNPSLMKMFNLVSVGEKAGSGFDTMRSGCAWANASAPILSETFLPDRTLLTIGLPRNTREFASPKQKHDDNLGAVESILRREGTIKRSDIEKELGLSRNAAVNLLKELVRNGIAVQKGAGPSTVYQLI